VAIYLKITFYVTNGQIESDCEVLPHPDISPQQTRNDNRLIVAHYDYFTAVVAIITSGVCGVLSFVG